MPRGRGRGFRDPTGAARRERRAPEWRARRDPSTLDGSRIGRVRVKPARREPVDTAPCPSGTVSGAGQAKLTCNQSGDQHQQPDHDGARLAGSATA